MTDEPPASSPYGRLAGLQADQLMAGGLSKADPTIDGLEVIRVIGAGGMGTVYLASQTGLDRNVAVKVVSERFAGDPMLLERLEREAKTMARLQHPNIVKMFDFLRLPDGSAAIIMEFVEGGDLRKRIVEGHISVEDALRIGREIAIALAEAHESGVVHRDMKPENILIGKDDSPRVVDFGLAVPFDATETRLTMTGTTVGTMDYMPPESFHTKEPDARGDIYSLGVMVYEMLTCRVPKGSFDPPRKLRPEVPQAASAAVMKALRPEPGERFQSMADFADALDVKVTPSRRWIWQVASVAGLAFIMGYMAGGLLDPPPVPEPIRMIPQADQNGWHSLIPAVHIPRDRIQGDWSRDGDAIISDDSISILSLSEEVPRHYKIMATFTRLSGENSVAIFFRANGRVGSLDLDGWTEGIAGVQSIDGLDMRQTKNFPMRIENGRQYNLLMEVHPDFVTVWIDGVEKGTFDIKDKTLGMVGPWKWDGVNPAAAIAIGTYKSPTRFDKVAWKNQED